MATITCSRCNATTKANSIEEGKPLLDHACGLALGKPCEDGRASLLITGKVIKSESSAEKKAVGKKTKHLISKQD